MKRILMQDGCTQHVSKDGQLFVTECGKDGTQMGRFRKFQYITQVGCQLCRDIMKKKANAQI